MTTSKTKEIMKKFLEGRQDSWEQKFINGIKSGYELQKLEDELNRLESLCESTKNMANMLRMEIEKSDKNNKGIKK